MTDQKTTGTITDIQGKVEETAGKVTGNKEQEFHGKSKQVQGEAQKGLGDVQDSAQKTVADVQDAAQDTLDDAKDAVGGLKR